MPVVGRLQRPAGALDGAELAGHARAGGGGAFHRRPGSCAGAVEGARGGGVSGANQYSVSPRELVSTRTPPMVTVFRLPAVTGAPWPPAVAAAIASSTRASTETPAAALAAAGPAFCRRPASWAPRPAGGPSSPPAHPE